MDLYIPFIMKIIWSFQMITSHLHTHCTSLNSDRGAPNNCHTAIALNRRYYVYIFLQ